MKEYTSMSLMKEYTSMRLMKEYAHSKCSDSKRGKRSLRYILCYGQLNVKNTTKIKKRDNDPLQPYQLHKH